MAADGEAAAVGLSPGRWMAWALLAAAMLAGSAARAQTNCRTVTTTNPPSVETHCDSAVTSGWSASTQSRGGGGLSISVGGEDGADDRRGDDRRGDRRDGYERGGYDRDRYDRDGDGGAQRPRLIERARIGRIREIFGAARLVARPEDGCPARALVDGLCFARAAAGLTALGRDAGLVLGVRRPVTGAEPLPGPYGDGFVLYAVSLKDGAVAAAPVARQESEVSVPRDCFALPGEGVVYLPQRQGDQDVAQERQTVVCGGGPAQPRGPYRPDIPSPPTAGTALGAAPAADRDAWPPTGAWLARGPDRYLGVPADPTCDPAYLVHKTVCAKAGVMALTADASLKELDLILAKAPPTAGDLLARNQVEQWVLKRRDAGFKIDKRWFEKSYLPAKAGCARIEPVRFSVFDKAGALFVAEVAANDCGAPPAPVPADIYEAYGQELPTASHRDGCPQSEMLVDDLCFADAIAFMRGFGRQSTAVALLRGEIYPGAVLYPDHGLDVAVITRHDDGTFEVAGGQAPPTDGVEMDRCGPLDNGDPRRLGVKIVGRGNRPVAIVYQWMSCPIY